jgi:hypothetical protein
VTIGPVPPYVNAAPQPLTGLLIGAALTFGIAAAPLGPALQSEYTFGTHAAALITAEARKSQQWKSAAGGVVPRLGAYVIAGPAPFDPNVPAPWDPNAPATGGAVPRIGAFTATASAPFDPNVIAPVERNASATGGFLPRIAAYSYASPWPFDPANIPAQSFRIAAGPAGILGAIQWAGPGPLDSIQPVLDAPQPGPLRSTVRSYVTPFLGDPSVPAPQIVASVASLRFGPVPPAQWAAPVPMDSIQGWIETPMFNPQGALMAYQDGAPGDLWALAPQSFTATAGTPAPASAPLRMQLAAPQPLDAIAPFDPNASAKGGAVPIIGDYVVAAPLPFEPNSVAPQTFRIAAAAIGPVQLGQWAAPQPLDVIQGYVIDALFNPQGPTIRQFAAGPREQAPPGFAATFTITRVGTVPGIGPVPPMVVTSSSPVDPTPPSAQKFGSAAGGALPIIGSYQVVSGRLTPETPQPDYSAPLVGSSLAVTYQFAAPQPLDVLAAQTRAAQAGSIGVVRPFVTAWPQQIDLTPPAVTTRASVGYQGPTVRSFAAAPPFTDVTVRGVAYKWTQTAGMAAFPTIPTIRFMLADYPQRIVLSPYTVRIVS